MDHYFGVYDLDGMMAGVASTGDRTAEVVISEQGVFVISRIYTKQNGRDTITVRGVQIFPEAMPHVEVDQQTFEVDHIVYHNYTEIDAQADSYYYRLRDRM